jgi:O-antigen biosynthesis protein WbqV
MVQISTDKAINPTSIMGATKRLAERYCQALDLSERGAPDAAGGGTTRFVTVRFGNVLGSTGSVVPLFQRQIAHGGPVTVTDPEMTRYFMTVREAVQLVLQASAQGLDGTQGLDGGEGLDGAQGLDGAEVGKIYVLDMGEPVKIVDLARQVIRLAGLIPGKDIDIVYTGARPGEKLHEELFQHGEESLPTGHPALRLAATRATELDLLEKGLDELARQARTGRLDEMCNSLRRLVPSYQAPENDAPRAAAL